LSAAGVGDGGSGGVGREFFYFIKKEGAPSIFQTPAHFDVVRHDGVKI
jgi:hypothetical protein